MNKIASLILTALVIGALFAFVGTSCSNVPFSNPTNLAIYTGTPTIPADNNIYPYVYVQLQNSSGKPAKASENIVISLSSSNAFIGSIPSSITIKKGDSIAIANFFSTFDPGTTTISASAVGFETVTTTVKTVGPIPSALGVYGIPPTLPADGGTYDAIMVQLQDSSGFPARAPRNGVTVSLTSSNTAVGTVSLTLRINETQTCAIAKFTAISSLKIQTTTITAVSQGYKTGQATITTTPIASNPTNLKIFSGPAQTPADAGYYKQIAVQLQNASGYVAKKAGNTTVNLASNDNSICTLGGINIPAQQTYALAMLFTTYKAGQATLTAVANDFQSTSQLIRTVGFTPSKLAVYCPIPILPADGAEYYAVHVQLQDPQGQPARATENVIVSLFSSQPTIGIVSNKVSIPIGQTQAVASVSTTYLPGNATITAQASGYTNGQKTLSSCIIDRYEIFGDANGNGVIAPSGSVIASIGVDRRFNIIANTGYHIVDVLVDNVSQGAVSSYTFTKITNNHTITASFAINTYKITVNQTANGLITPNSSTFNYSSTPEFMITPDTGYSISKIFVNDQSIPVTATASGIQKYQFSHITNNGNLTALFVPNKYTIKVIQENNGVISPGTTVLNYSETQTFTITPDPGFNIADVLVNGNSVGAINTYTIQNINESATISVVYKPEPTPSPSSTPAPTSTPTITPSPTNFPDTSSFPEPTAPTSSDLFAAVPMSIRYALAAVLVLATGTMAFIIKKKTAGDKTFEMHA